MKILGFAIILLLSLASASTACSKSCCAGKTKCCCSTKSSPVPHSQKTDGFSQTHQSAATKASGCSCGENAPQPFAESHAVAMPQSSPSPKNGVPIVSIFKNTRLSIGNFSFNADHSPPNGHNDLTIPIPLRI